MEISADTRTELEGMLAEIMCPDTRAIDLATCERRIAACHRLTSLAAAVEAELLPIHRRLLGEAARSAAAQAAADRDQAGDDSAGRPDPSADEPPAEPAGAPPPPPRPRESARARQQRELRSKWLEFYPALNDALAAGRITPEHVDALAGVFERTPPAIVAEFQEPWLVHHAETFPPEGFASFLRDEINRIRDDGGEAEYQRQINDSWAWMGLDRTTGMYLLKLGIDPVRGAQLRAAIEQRVTQLRNQPGGDKLRYAQLFLQAIIDLMLSDVQIVIESLVIVDHQTATTARQHPSTVCENVDGVPVPVGIAVNACAAGNVTAAIVDSTGKVIDYGCASALADKKQRHLQRIMYRECAHPDCTVPYSQCEIHHVIFREHDGKTVMSNLVPLCFRHHHQIHDDQWTLTIDDQRTLCWYRPDGTPSHVVHLRRLDDRSAGEPGAPQDVEPPGPRPSPAADDPPDERPPPGDVGSPGDQRLFDPHAA